MLADRLEEWALDYKAQGVQEGIQQGMQEGRQEGRQQGEMLALQKIIIKRFGVIPPDVLSVIAGASSEQIELWLDQILDARSLEELFKH